jgi:hypothetical protein
MEYEIVVMICPGPHCILGKAWIGWNFIAEFVWNDEAI